MSVLSEIGQTHRCYAAFRAKRLEKHGIYGYQYLYLINIHRSPGITQDQLADQLIFNKSSVARQLSALEENGFVRRERSHEDRRVLTLTLTEKAEALIPEIWQTSRDFLAAVTEGFSEADKVELNRLMSKIREKAKEAIE